MSLARAVLAAALAAPLAARAGVVIEGKGKDGSQRFVMQGEKLRMDGRDQKHTVIFDAAAKTMTQVDRERKVYSEITQADMEQMNAMVRQRREAAGAGAQKPFSIHYEKTGQKDSDLGKTCEVYRVVHEEKERHERKHESEACLAPFGTFGVEKSDFAPFRAFGEFASQIAGAERVDRTWADLPGVPLIGWDVSDGKREETFRATKVEKGSVPASEFAVPAGFAKGPSMSDQMKQMQERMKQMPQHGAPPAK